MKRLPRVSMLGPVADDVALIIESEAEVGAQHFPHWRHPHIKHFFGVPARIMAEMVISDDEEAYFKAWLPPHVGVPENVQLAIGVPHCTGPGREHGREDGCTLNRSDRCARHRHEGVPPEFYKELTHEQVERAIDAGSLCAWKCPDIYRFGGQEGVAGAKTVLDRVVAERKPGWLPPQPVDVDDATP